MSRSTGAAPDPRSPGARPGRGGLTRIALFAVVLVLALFGAAGAAGRLTREYDLKAAFLFNFTRFVSWPREAVREPNAPFVIGILGEDPFGSSLEEIVANETVNGHPIVVSRFRTPREIGPCHILFVHRAEAPRLAEVRQALRNRSVLLVSDAPGFASRGGVVEFVVSGSRVKLLINASRAREMGLAISSQLLRQASLVGRS